MAKPRSGMPLSLQQRLQQSNAARSRHVQQKGTGHALSLDLRTAGEPDRIYYAKDAWLEYDRGVVCVYFCQRRRDDEKKLRSLVCVNFAPDYAVRWLASIDGMDSPGLAEIGRMIGVEAEPTTPIFEEAEQTVEVSANVARVAVSGFETTLDFIKITTISMAEAKNTGSQLKTLPQVRVELRTALFMGLVESLRAMKDQFTGAVLERVADDVRE